MRIRNEVAFIILPDAHMLTSTDRQQAAQVVSLITLRSNPFSLKDFPYVNRASNRTHGHLHSCRDVLYIMAYDVKIFTYALLIMLYVYVHYDI